MAGEFTPPRPAAGFASGMGTVDDMVLTDIILREKLPIEALTPDTGMRRHQHAANLPIRQFGENNPLEKFNPLSDWTEQEVWSYIHMH